MSDPITHTAQCEGVTMASETTARSRDFDDVELCATGTWNASTGEATITRDDLQAILDAQDDVDHAPVKLGHTSSLNEGEPAYGWVTPTRIEHRNGRDVLLGKLTGIPNKLADVMGTAYRRRSVEIGWKVKGLSGRTHRAALVGIALLGVQAPAVKSLADALAFYSDDSDFDSRSVSVVSFADASPTLVEDSDHDQREEHVVTDAPNTEDLRARLERVSDEELRALVGERLGTTAPVATPTTDAPTDPAPVADVTPEPVPAPVREPELTHAASAAPDVDPNVVTLSAASYAALSARAEKAERAETEGFLDSLVGTGKIAPAERAWAAGEVAKHGDAAKSMLSGLQARYPVSELGADNAAPNTTDGPDWDTAVNAPAFG